MFFRCWLSGEGYGATDVATYAHVKHYAVCSPVLLSSQLCASTVAAAVDCESLALGSQHASAKEEVSDGVFIGHFLLGFGLSRSQCLQLVGRCLPSQGFHLAVARCIAGVHR